MGSPRFPLRATQPGRYPCPEHSKTGQKFVVSMQEAVLGFMISSLHEFFTGNDVGNWPTEVADGHFTLRIPDMRDAVWVKRSPIS